MDQQDRPIEPRSNAATQDSSSSATRIGLAIEEFRKRLLDLSLANPMLNFRLSERSKRHIRLVDEIPSILMAKLQKGTKLVFAPVELPPEEPDDEKTTEFRQALADARGTDQTYLDAKAKLPPRAQKREARDLERALRDRLRAERGMAPWKQTLSAKEEAEKLGIPTSYDLPREAVNGNKRHADDRLQTLYFPDDLEAKLEAIHGATSMLEKDAGVQALYAAFGFLEWTESRSSSEFMMAPLLLWPISMERRLNVQRYEYAIAGRDEDESVNKSLAEKMKESFGLLLPNLDDFENEETGAIDLNGWLAAVDEAAKSIDQRWQVRNQLVVGLMTFHKIAIWEDLDAAKWPAHADPRRNPILAEVFGAGEPWDGNPAADHDIDRIEQSGQSPLLITDADSSQHSAVIDALDGRSMVIQGPPGTGKSQTITNIISAVLAAGKTCLFVSEKMAALEVVKKRLDAAGLGDFCLELHSDKASRSAVLESLASRLALTPPRANEAELDAARRSLEDCRAKLTAYVSRMNALAGDTGKTVHDVFWGHARTKAVLAEGPSGLKQARIANPLAYGSFERDELARIANALESAATSFGELAQPSLQPWRGIGRTDLTAFDAEEVEASARAAAAAIAAYIEAAEIATRLAGWQSIPDSISALSSLVIDATESAPQILPDNRVNSALKDLESADARAAATDLLRHLEDLNQARDILVTLGDPEALARASTERLGAAMRSAGALEVGNLDTVGLGQETERRKSVLDRAQAAIAAFRKMPAPAITTCEPMAALLAAIAIEAPSAEQRALARPELAKDAASAQLKEAKTKATAVKLAFETIGKGADAASIPEEPAVLKAASNALRDTGFFGRMVSGDYRRAKALGLRIMPSLRKAHRTQIADMLDAAIDWRNDLKEFNDYRAANPILTSIAITPHSRFDDLIRVADWLAAVRKAIPLTVDNADALRRTVLDADDDQAALHAAFNAAHGANLLALVSGKDASIDQALATSEQEIRELSDLTRLLGTCGWCGGVPLGQLGAAAAATTRFVEKRASIATADRGRLALRALWRGEETDIALAREAIGAAAAISAWALPAAGITRIFDASREGSAAEAIRETKVAIEAAATAADRASAAMAALFDRVTLDLSAWSDGSAIADTSLSKFGRRAANAADNVHLLPRQCALVSLEADAHKAGLGQIVAAWVAADAAYKDLARATDAVWHRSAAETLVREDPALSAHVGHAHETVRKRYQELDKQVLALNRKVLAARLYRRQVPAGSRRGGRLEWTERELIAHQCSLERPSMHLRRLFAQAGEAIRGLKPCLLMSPMSVARYLKAGEHVFDVVIIDEASQMRPEDAAGSLLRAKQAIVCGDGQQLPPTSFFTAQGGGASSGEEDENEVIEESILELGMRAWKPVRALKWHYRSRHESLIAYSNSRFYDGRLVVFPSERDRGPEAGVHLVQVKGVYGDGINEIEARAMASAAVELMRTYPNQSLGLVTMNQKQQELINNLMLEEFRNDPVAESYRQHWDSTLEPFMVKNLETVQGDERDHILVGATYAPDVNGAFANRFGPINLANGHRRLNVLFTRAKHRMTIFSSMDPALIHVGPNSHEGVKVLKEYLDYARTGRLPETPQETADAAPESEFEQWFLARLKERGYHAVPQVGVRGYRIDIGVRHPDKPGRFILGIECDGATYHSSKSARDRDRLRQAVLEALGWQIHRVWSTDWFRDAEAELRTLIQKIETLRTADRQPVVELHTA